MLKYDKNVNTSAVETDAVFVSDAVTAVFVVVVVVAAVKTDCVSSVVCCISSINEFDVDEVVFVNVCVG
jgi:hypothetical protein